MQLVYTKEVDGNGHGCITFIRTQGVLDFHGQVVEFEFLTLSVTYPPYSKPAHFQSSRVANPIRPLTSSITFTGGLYSEGPLLNG